MMGHRLGEIADARIRSHGATSLVSAGRMSDQGGLATSGSPGQHVAVGVADHPRPPQVDRELRARPPGASRGRACDSHTGRKLRDDAVGVVQAEPKVIEPAPSAARSSTTRDWTWRELLTDTLPLAAAG